MNTDLDRVLHDAFSYDVDAPPPIGIADAVVGRVRRRRARLRMATAASVVALALVAVPLAVTTRHGSDAPAASDQVDGRRFVVTAFSNDFPRRADYPDWPTFDRYSSRRSVLLDPATGRYGAPLPYGDIVPSPDGKRALVYNQGEEISVGILDHATKQVHWIDRDGAGLVGRGSWSLDGRQVLLTEISTQGVGGFLVVDTATLKSSFVPVEQVKVDALKFPFVWAPGGKTIALTYADRNGGGPNVRRDEVRFYDLTGTLLRTVDVEGTALWSSSDFSPDGTRMALTSAAPRAPGSIEIVRTTGGARQSVRAPGNSTLLGWYDDDHLIIRTYSPSNESTRVLRIVDLTGHTTRIVRLPDHATDYLKLYIGPATGEATELAF